MRSKQRYWSQRPDEDPAHYREPLALGPAGTADSVPTGQALLGGVGTGPLVGLAGTNSRPSMNGATQRMRVETLPEARLFSGDVLKMYQQALQRQLVQREL
jgi:hypothetical protein